MEAINNPEDEGMGSRMVKFSRELWIERDDFMEDAPRKYFRLTPGNEVRLQERLHREMYRVQEGMTRGTWWRCMPNMTR